MRLHLVDGTYELFRAHYSPRPGHEDPKGRDRKATVGVVASLLSLIADADEQVTHLAVAFDNPIRSFRNDLFDGYKTGEGIEPELRAQFDPVEEAVAALGVVVWSMDQWEADDAMASGADQFADQVEQVRLMTPDKDLGQCVRDGRVVQIDRMRGKFIDEDKLRELRGFGPGSVPDWLALVGDSADGIPGLPGFGAKSAATLLGHYEHVENIPDLPDEWEVHVRGAKRLAATLAEHRDKVMLYKKLATLVTDVPLQESLGDLEYRGTPRAAWTRWCEAVGRVEWIDRPKRWQD
jgi:5'-3' exonuclease